MNVDGESGLKVYSEILVMASTLLLEQSKVKNSSLSYLEDMKDTLKMVLRLQ